MAVNPNLRGMNIDQEAQSFIFDDDGVQWNFGDGNWLAHYPTKRVTKDIRYQMSKGIHSFRVASGDLTDPMTGFREDRFQYHLHTCELVLQAGGHVEFGAPPLIAIKPSQWGYWLDNVITYAAQFNALVDQYSGNGSSGYWIIGNENETLFVSASTRDIITSMTRVSNVITIVSSAKHFMQTGDDMIYYATPTGNGGATSEIGVNSNSLHIVTVVDDYTFTFTSVGTNATTTLGWFQYGPKTCRLHMVRRATYFKANGITVPLTYSCLQGNDYNGQNNVKAFGVLGYAPIDFLDVNLYGVGSTHPGRFNDFCLTLNELILRSPTGRVTEVNNGFDNGQVDPNTLNNTHWWMERWNQLERKNVFGYAFCYRQPSNLLVLKKPHNTDVAEMWRDWWWPFINERSPFVEASISTVTRVSDLRNQKLDQERFSSRIHWNYGQDQQDGTYDTATITSDFDAIISFDHTKVRSGGAQAGTSGVTSGRQLSLYAKSRNLYVNHVVGSPAGTLTDANFATWKTFVLGEIAWAVSNNLDEVCIANELEHWQTQEETVTNVIDQILDVYDTAHALYPTLKMNIAILQSALDFAGADGGWIERAGDVLSRSHLYLGYNIYADDNLTPDQARDQFRNRITDLFEVYGTRLFISEGVLGVGLQRPTSQIDQGIEIRRRCIIAIEIGILDIYLFTWRWDKASTFNQAWPIRVGTAYKSWFPYIYDTIRPVRETGISADRLALDSPRDSI